MTEKSEPAESPQEELAESPDTESSETKIPAKEIAKWKKEILAINDRDLLDYIRQLVQARLDIGRAHHQINKAAEKPKKGNPVPEDYRGPKKLPPMMASVEPENLDEVS